MKPRIVREIDRPSADVVARLGRLGVATVHEGQGRTGMMRPYMRPIFPTARLASPAVTILCHPSDNVMIHAAIEVCKPGDALVVATMSESTDGMFGELLATTCVAHGITGLVIDAGVRDVTDLTSMSFPVWSKAISAQGTVKATAGWVNVEIVCAGAAVRPGDIVIADQDGVVVVPRANAEEVLRLSQERQQRESAARERLQKGELGMDMYGLRTKLAELDVVYVDREDVRKKT